MDCSGCSRDLKVLLTGTVPGRSPTALALQTVAQEGPWEQGVLRAGGPSACLLLSFSCPELAREQMVPLGESTLNLLLHHLCVTWSGRGLGDAWRGLGCTALLVPLQAVGTPALESFVWPGRGGQYLPAVPQLPLCSRLCAFQRNEKYDYAAHIP